MTNVEWLYWIILLNGSICISDSDKVGLEYADSLCRKGLIDMEPIHGSTVWACWIKSAKPISPEII